MHDIYFRKVKKQFYQWWGQDYCYFWVIPIQCLELNVYSKDCYDISMKDFPYRIHCAYKSPQPFKIFVCKVVLNCSEDLGCSS